MLQKPFNFSQLRVPEGSQRDPQKVPFWDPLGGPNASKTIQLQPTSCPRGIPKGSPKGPLLGSLGGTKCFKNHSTSANFVSPRDPKGIPKRSPFGIPWGDQMLQKPFNFSQLRVPEGSQR